MSTEFAVKVVRIKEITALPGADRLEIAHIAGWQCVIGKGSYQAGDLAVYIPIDSILPYAVESTLFGPDSKIKLSKSRVRTIKIRGAISQGMLAACKDLRVIPEEGHDCTKFLGITKFEPPEAPSSMRTGNAVSKKKKNPLFKEYGGLDNFKHYPDLFAEGEQVVITEKIHGTNFRFGWLPTSTDTNIKKLKKMLGILPEYEFVFGSNKVQLQNRASSSNKWKVKLLSWIPIKGIRTIAYQGYYQQNGAGNVYEEAVKKNDLKKLTENYANHVFYGEIYGASIQKDYEYGCKEGERKLVVFDIMSVVPGQAEEQYLSQDQMAGICKQLGLSIAPELYRGPYSKAQAKELTFGHSVMVPSQKVREGVVIRPLQEEKCHIGRKLLKFISDEYLLKEDNTDFH